MVLVNATPFYTPIQKNVVGSGSGRAAETVIFPLRVEEGKNKIFRSWKTLAN